jgi:hypothetical protein
MRKFSLVSPRIWTSRRFTGLPSDNGRLLYLYLLTCGHQTSIGAYPLPDAYACADLQWDLERYLEARQELTKADLIAFDPDASVVAIRRWFKHNPVTNDKHRMGALRLISELESPSIIDVIMGDYDDAMGAKDIDRPTLLGTDLAPGNGTSAASAALQSRWPVTKRRGS